VRIWLWSKRNPKFAGALAATIVLAMLNLLAVFAISHLLSIVSNARLAHHRVASVQFQDSRQLSATMNSVTEAMKSLDSFDSNMAASPDFTEPPDAHLRINRTPQPIEL
jgi:hypothetical protein